MTDAAARRRHVAARSFALAEVFGRHSVLGGVVRGYAAPGHGGRPSQVVLQGGSELLAVATCDGFSDEAAREGIRLGWCGFTLGGLPAAAALGQGAELLCAVSGRPLAAWSRDDLAQIDLATRRPLVSVPGLRRYVNGLNGCGEARQIIPFLARYAERRPMRELIAALWRYFLRRPPLDSEIDKIVVDLPDEWKLEWLLDRVTSTDEFKAGPGFPFPGPFEPEFPFDRELAFAAAA